MEPSNSPSYASERLIEPELTWVSLEDKIKLPNVKNLRENYDVVFHIGAPKTGSSALQKFFVEQSAGLLESGFYYPQHALDENGVSAGHSELAVKLIGEKCDEAKLQFDSFVAQAKESGKVLLLSSEAFYSIKPQAVAALTGDLKCKIIAFFRDPIESIRANYNQAIKRHFATLTPEQFCSHTLRNPAEYYTGDTFNRWIETFGKNNVEVYGYDVPLFQRHSIQEVFLRNLGLSEREILENFSIENRVINRGYSFAALELKRLLNHVLDRNQNINHQLDCFLQGVSDESIEKTIPIASMVTPSTYDRLVAYFRDKSRECLSDVLVVLDEHFLETPNETNLEPLPRKGQTFCEMFYILNRIEREKEPLYSHLKEKAERHLSDDLVGSDAHELANLFNIEVKKTNSDRIWFTHDILERMTGFHDVDFLREISYLAYERGDIKHAQKLIEKARELRPDGPYIVAFSNKLRDEILEYHTEKQK